MFVDFDGTLAPIVDDPAAARPHRMTIDVLNELADRWGLVAVLSGRPAEFLAEHLAGSGATEFLGLYGLERITGRCPGVETLHAAEEWRGAISAAADEAEAALGRSGAVERKGLTVTFHYRVAPSEAAELERLAATLAERYGLRAHPAKMSVELRPPVEVDKGTVVLELSSGLAAVAFAGDDIGDLPAFASLTSLRAAGKATLSIASSGPETPAQVIDAADIEVDGPAGILEVLRDLAAG